MLRIATEDDVLQILRIYAPYVENTTITFEYDVPSLPEFMQRFQAVTAQYPWLVWEEAGEILGYAYASAPYARAAYAWCAEPSVYLHPQAKRKGIGRRLYAGLEALLKLQGYQILYTLITSENSDSLEFHRKMGYITRVDFPDCGFKFGRWLGVTWMEKRLTSVIIPSGNPLPWSVLRQDIQKISDILYNLSIS